MATIAPKRATGQRERDVLKVEANMPLAGDGKTLYGNVHTRFVQASVDRSFHLVKRAPAYGEFNGCWDVPRASNDNLQLPAHALAVPRAAQGPSWPNSVATPTSTM